MTQPHLSCQGKNDFGLLPRWASSWVQTQWQWTLAGPPGGKCWPWLFSVPGSTPTAVSPEGPDEQTWFLVWLSCGLSEFLAGSRCGPLLCQTCYKEAILHTWAVTVSTPLTAMLWSKEKWEQLLANLLGLSSITHIPEPSPPAKVSCILFPDMALLPVSRRSILLLSGSVPNQPSASKLVFTFKWFQVPQSPEIPWTPGSCTAHSGDSHGLGSSCEQLDYYVYIWALLLFLSSLREPAFVSSGVYSLMFCS